MAQLLFADRHRLRGPDRLGPSLYGFQLAAFLDHFDRNQVLVIAVDRAAVDLDERYQDNRSMDKPVPRPHDLDWLPRRQFKPQPRWRPDQRTGLVRLLTTRRARGDDSAIPRELRDRLAACLAADMCRFEHLLGHQVPSHWGWSTSVSA